MECEKPQINFGSPEELAEIFEEIGMRLHGKNRIGGDESRLLWLIAETSRKLGQLTLRSNSREMDELFDTIGSTGSLGSRQDEEFWRMLKTVELD